MRHIKPVIVLSFLIFINSFEIQSQILIKNENKNPQVLFALKDLKEVVLSKKDNFSIEIKQNDSCCEKEGYQIQKLQNTITVNASDANGLMYGIFEITEQLKIGKTFNDIKELTEIPYIKKRGIKYNIPLDIRTSAFDDSGDAAQKNIATVWEFSFWEHFFDNMARNRYNVIAFWNAHPFSSMIQLEDYPDVALQDVWGTNIDPQKEPYAWTVPELANIKPVQNKKVIKKMTIKEKTTFWKKVMQHAKDRGIDIYFITWNICLNGAAPLGSNKEAKGKVGKYGITNDYKNKVSVDYLRKSVKKFLLTFPHVKGIGVTAGENMRKPMDNDDKESWLWSTYGLGILDVKKIQKERKVDFIHRFWWTKAEQIEKYWGDYPDSFEMSFKYAKARLYSKIDPPFYKPLIPWMKPLGLKSWWNLRNDDIYIHRWSDPEYVSGFIKNLPYEKTAGFQMGSDGYVWGKEFISKNPKLQGQFEMDKHWMRFLLWGRLGYNPNINDTRFKSIIAQKFKEVDIEKLYSAWKNSSKIIPAINTFHWRDWDYMWQPEANFDIWNDFKNINTFREVKTMEGSNILNIQEYVSAKSNNEDITKKTPLNVVESLKTNSTKAIAIIDEIYNEDILDIELKETLLDIKSMGYLGNYYAHKISGALALEFFKVNGKETHKKDALKEIAEAISYWKLYQDINTPRYKPQNMSRLRTFNFANRLPMAQKDLELIKISKTYKEEENIPKSK